MFIKQNTVTEYSNSKRKLFPVSCNLSSKKGFTLIEMVVVVAIFSVLTTVVVFKYGDFNSNILVTNMAYEIALTARQAQVFGLGARGFDETGTKNEFDFPYGIFFNLHDGSTGNDEETKRLAFFVDRDDSSKAGYGQCSSTPNSTFGGDCTCVAGGVDECIEQLTMQQSVKITELRLSDSSGQDCTNESEYKVAVTFKRPSPEARIEDQTNGSDGYNFLQIKVESRGNVDPAYVLIRKTGQISVSKNSICSV